MSQDTQQNLFGFQSDNDESLVITGSSDKVFGLNQGVVFTNAEYREKDQQGNINPSINLEFETLGGSKGFYTIYSNVTVFDKNGQIRTDTDAADYKDRWAKEFSQLKAVLTHFCKQVLSEEQYRAKYEAANIRSISDLMAFSFSGIKTLVDNKIKLDVFLQYQGSIKKDNTRTFLELPRNLKSGYFLAKDSTGTKWEEVIDEKGGLTYVSGNNKHLFERTKSFLESSVAKEQVKEASSSEMVSAAGAAMNNGASIPTPSSNNNWL